MGRVLCRTGLEDREVDLHDSLPPPTNLKLRKAWSKVAEGFKKWRPASEELTVVRSVPTRFVQFDRATRVKGFPIERITTIHGPSNQGKAQSLDTPILTPNGWKPLGSLVVGDLVIAVDGTPSRILGVFPQGSVPLYKVEFNDRTSTICCENHLWFTRTSNERNRGRYIRAPRPDRTRIDSGIEGPGSLKTLRSIMSKFEDREHEIPMCDPVQFDPLGNLPIDPYLLGLLLGDGGFTGTSLVFHKPERDLWDRISEMLPNGDELRVVDDISVRLVGGTLLAKIRKLGLWGCRSWEKFIPELYMRSSIDDRRQLLCGLLDTDGYVCSGNGGALEYSTTSFNLADQVAELARSLGWFVVRGNPKDGRYTKDGVVHTTRPNVRMLIWASVDSPISSVKHLAKWGGCKQKHKKIVDITSVGNGEASCILIDHPSHLYVCNDYIVTHNTLFSMGLIDSFLALDHSAALVDAEFTTPWSWAETLMGDRANHPAFMAQRPTNYQETVNAVREYCNVILNARNDGTLPPDTSGLIVVDSIRKLIPKDLMDDVLKVAKESKQGNAEVTMLTGRAGQIKAQMNQAWLDELVPLLGKTGTAMLLIARESDKEGASADDRKFDNAWAVAGGRGVIFDASLVMRITRAAYVYQGSEEDKKIIGERHKVRIWKTKVEGKEGKYTDCFFHTSNGTFQPYGFDRARDVLELAVHYKIVEQGGTWFRYQGQALGQGQNNVVRKLNDSPDTLRSIETAVREAFNPDEELPGGIGEGEE